MSLWQSAYSVIKDQRTGSLGRFDILRFGTVGVFETIESGIAITAADRTDSDYGEEIPLHGAASM
jgi:hypothetical protein